MGFSSLMKRIDKAQAGKKALQDTANYVEKAIPIVQTIHAGYASRTYRFKKMVDNVGNVAGNINDIVEKAKEFVPEMQVMGKSFAYSAKIFLHFNSIAAAAGIGTSIVLAYQGFKVLQLIDSRLKDIGTHLAAQTALIAQKDFPRYVHNMIRERVTQTSLDADCDHWFFVFHPDNDWYPGFYDIVASEPIGPQFCGYTNQIDTAFAFMLAARERIRSKERRARAEGQHIRPTKLHLLIPAYQPMVIPEALEIPEEIGDFKIEGRINSGREFVWLNLPEGQRHYVQNIGNFVPPAQGWFDWAMSALKLSDPPPKLGKRRVLGTGPASAEGGGDDSDIPDDSGEEQERNLDGQDARAARDAMPLDRRHREHHGMRHRRHRRRDSTTTSSRYAERGHSRHE